MTGRMIVLIILFISSLSVLFLGLAKSNEGTFEEKREKVITGLFLSIEEAVGEGKYECCIEPPCTMCYLGNWLWEDGICRCDEMMENGEWDKVCPQCVKGIEEGLCKSAKGNICGNEKN